MSRTLKHVHQFDTNRSFERKVKGNNLKRKDDNISPLINEEEIDIKIKLSESKPLSDKREW